MRGRLRVCLLGGVWLVAAALVSAAPLRPEEVPEPLAPWVDWVLRGHEAERCSRLLGREGLHVCAWPSQLSLELSEHQGRFVQSWRVERRLWVPLPGDFKRWPQDVRVDGAAAPVVGRGVRPGLELGPGDHRVDGVFRWDDRPELLQIPPETALVDLVLVDGEGRRRSVGFPRRDLQGRLWLRQRAVAEAGEESQLEAKVHRRVIDDVPLRLVTRVELEVSGRPRELRLGRALPQGFAPMSLVSPIPARLDPDGRLRVQVRPGSWRIELEARHLGPVEWLELADPGGPWARSEVWVFEARPQLRLVTLEEGVAVDPQQTGLPAEWRHLPAYLMEPGRGLRLVEKRRGDSDPAPDVLHLDRSWWLDFDGGGYTVSDRIWGEIRRSGRLEMAPATRLGRVSVNGRDQFITRLEDGPSVGIEVPRGGVEITADSRIESAGSRIPAVGWEHDFQRLEGRLNLPPGWRLVHALGVDRIRSTWVNRWTLLDIFAVLVMAMASYRLWGRVWGLVAGLALVLSFTEPGAPQWVWAAVLAGEGLRRVLSPGRLAMAVTLYRAAALAVLLLIGIPFAVDQVRTALHPALEHPGSAGSGVAGARSEAGTVDFVRLKRLEAEGDIDAATLPQEGRIRAEQVQQRATDERRVLAESAPPPSKAGLLSSLADYAPDPAARITTGPGLPAWSWNSVELHWNGPVEHSQTLRLLLLPPWATSAFAFLRVGLLAAFALCVFGAWRWRAGRFMSSVGPAVVLLLSLGVRPQPVRADFPSDALLDELRSRLLEAPECQPACAASPRMRLDVGPRRLSARLEVDAVGETAVPLPGGAGSWIPERVIVAGKPARGLRRDDEGVLWLQLTAGKHEVLLQGSLPERESVDLPLPLLPHRVEARVEGWTLQGLHEDGLAEPTLKLARVREQERRPQQGETLDASLLPPFVRVVRRIQLGLTWQVETRVERVTPDDAAVVLEIPLLPGERVTGPGVRVEGGRVLVSMSPGTRSVGWPSVLEEREELLMRAAEQTSWSEIWQLDASPIWHLEVEGIPVVHSPSASRARVREWRPWPGEEVRVRVSRPTGVEGRTVTVDSSLTLVRPGLRATDVNLELVLRSSLGGQHAIVLPEGATLESVTIGGQLQPIRQEGREVRLPLSPGTERVTLVWREGRGIGWNFETAEVDLAMSSVNAQAQIAMPTGRWTLLTRGPRLGPSVLFWSFLTVVALISFALGQIRLTPLRFRHWFLLGLGLTQAPIWAAGMVVAWLLALGWRGEHGARASHRWFDALQVVLVLLTAIALTALFFSIKKGLLGVPEMQISGGGSSAHLLRWYQDRVGDQLVTAGVISVPLAVYRFTMLAWALWLAVALLRWLRWGWDCFSRDHLWLPLRSKSLHAKASPGQGGAGDEVDSIPG